MRADHPAGILHERADGLHQLGLGGVRGHVEDKNCTIVKPAQPQVAPVVGEPAVVRLMPAAHGYARHDLTVLVGLLGIGTDSDQFVRAIPKPFSA